MTQNSAQTLSSFLSIAKKQSQAPRASRPKENEAVVQILSTSTIGHRNERVYDLCHDADMDMVPRQNRQQYAKNNMSNNIDFIENKLAPLQEPERAYCFSALHDRSDAVDGDQGYARYQHAMTWCVSVLSQSASATLMLVEAAQDGWCVACDDLDGGDYCVDVEQKTLILDHHALYPIALGHSAYFKNVMLMNMVRGLRDIWQEKRHGGYDAIYKPESIMMMERVRVADLNVCALLAAWELRLEGRADVWRHMIGSEIGDMAMVLSGYLERDPAALFNGSALRATFDQWFRDEKRIRNCDRETLNFMDDVLDEDAQSNPFGTKSPGVLAIEIMSCLPDKTAYLQGHGRDILGKPLYFDIGNEINQAHLLHIMRDMNATIVDNVLFRDASLAQKIFPQ